MTELVAATEVSIANATHLTKLDAAAVEGLRALARKIDAWDQIVDYALQDMAGDKAGVRPRVPQNDNVSISAYLKYCESLGLTPAGRMKLDATKSAETGGSLGKLRLAHGKSA